MPIGNLLGCWKHVYMYYCCQILPIVDQLASQWYGINFTNSPNSTCTYETVSHLRSKSTTNNAHTLVDPIPLSFSPISMHPTNWSIPWNTILHFTVAEIEELGKLFLKIGKTKQKFWKQKHFNFQWVHACEQCQLPSSSQRDNSPKHPPILKRENLWGRKKKKKKIGGHWQLKKSHFA